MSRRTGAGPTSLDRRPASEVLWILSNEVEAREMAVTGVAGVMPDSMSCCASASRSGPGM